MKRKILALVLACVMCISVAAFATEGGNTITIKDSIKGYTYVAMQIFSGDVANDKKTLSNIDWGSNINSADFLDAIKSDDTFKIGNPAKNIFESAATASDVAEALSTTVTNDSDMAKRFAFLAGRNTTGSGTTLEWNDVNKNYSGNVAPGYYLIENTSVPTQSGENNSGAYTEFIMKVVGVAEATPKRKDVSVDKKVGEKNDSSDTGATVVDDTYADYDIGDDVPFKLTATTAANVHAYKKYHVTFEDTQTGFKAPTSFSVTVGNNSAVTLTSEDEWASKTITDDVNGVKITVEKVDNVSATGFKVKVTFESTSTDALQIATDAYNSATITVDYTAELDSSAQIGNPGNPNKVKLHYSNNPNSKDDSEEGSTPEKTVVVFTYKMDVDKIAKNATRDGYEAKTGAGFTLYKKYIEEVAGKENAAEKLGKNDTEFWYAVGEEVKGDGVTNFNFNGLDAGNYILVETLTPDGYNTMQNLEFEITRTIETGGTNGYEIKTLSGPTGYVASPSGGKFTFTRKKADGSGDESVTTKIDGTTTELVSGEIFGQIENVGGTTLPSTGGIGTTIFYVLGALLVVGAGILLVTRRRMNVK